MIVDLWFMDHQKHNKNCRFFLTCLFEGFFKFRMIVGEILIMGNCVSKVNKFVDVSAFDSTVQERHKYCSVHELCRLY